MKQYNSILKSIVILWGITMLFSCSKKIEEVRQFYRENESIPAAETTDFKLSYTLSGNKVLILFAPLMIDYTNQKDFPYQYFPKNITIELIDQNSLKKTIITADEAYLYKDPELAELIGHVHIIGADGSSLETSHLYWDGVHKHIFGEEKTVLRQNDEQITGIGFDSSLDFKNVRLNKITGILRIENNLKK